jgi:hypothetical protein
MRVDTARCAGGCGRTLALPSLKTKQVMCSECIARKRADVQRMTPTAFATYLGDLQIEWAIGGYQMYHDEDE